MARLSVYCLTDFDELIKTQSLKEHGIYYCVPSLLKHFQSAQINELIVPRPLTPRNATSSSLQHCVRDLVRLDGIRFGTAIERGWMKRALLSQSRRN